VESGLKNAVGNRYSIMKKAISTGIVLKYSLKIVLVFVSNYGLFLSAADHFITSFTAIITF